MWVTFFLCLFFEGWGGGGSVALSIRSFIARLHPTGKKYLEKFSCSAVIVRAFNTLFAPPYVEAPLITLIWPRLWLISLEEWFKAVKVLSRIKSFVAALERQIQKSHSRLSHDFVVEWHWLFVGSTKRKKKIAPFLSLYLWYGKTWYVRCVQQEKAKINSNLAPIHWNDNIYKSFRIVSFHFFLKFVLMVWKIYTTLRKNVVTIRLQSENALEN